ncbi:hypothetical protein LB524_14550 [Mesorhizobium sp. ESP6-5]|nr:hypothetical protein [Mesorhizobium sp. ESP6-5]
MINTDQPRQRATKIKHAGSKFADCTYDGLDGSVLPVLPSPVDGPRAKIDVADPQVVNELLFSPNLSINETGALDPAASVGRGTVTVFDTTSRVETGKVEFEVPGIRREGVQAVDIEMARDGATAYVALGSANRVAEVDAKTLAVRRLYLVGQRPWHLALSDDQKRLVSANGNSGDISFIDLENEEVVKSVPVGRGPWGVVIGP